uniref:Putative gamma-glutamylcyclotransferase n=1 Tax=Phaeomonas parva TaxID=124430 RepID=A0A7S1UEV1_9STRA|mmetsp:Transcript_45105/g.141280  ORF Transcript_45105/g.141280 Transcript_45105/m.141280 type:complete len:188 (+) Transcript_45105:234-797(+)
MRAAMTNIFVYGSLMSHEVQQVLLRRIPPQLPAVAHGFHRFQIKDRCYPAVTALAEGSVQGRLLCGLTEKETKLFDLFEEEDYSRQVIQVATEEPFEGEAHMYLWVSGDAGLYGEWKYDEHFVPNLAGFVEMCKEFMLEDEARLPPHLGFPRRVLPFHPRSRSLRSSSSGWKNQRRGNDSRAARMGF